MSITSIIKRILDSNKAVHEYKVPPNNVVRVGVINDQVVFTINSVDVITASKDKIYFNREVELDGNLTFTDTVWDDLRSPATAINPPGQVSDPDWDNTNGGWLFDAAGTEVLWLIVQMPHGWKEGTAIRPHIHWMPTNTNTGNVLWRMEYKWTNVHGTDAGTFSTLNVLDAGDGTALKHQIAGFEEIDGTGKTLSSMLSIKLSRIGGDVTDTYNADALLKEFDIHYQMDALGSDEEYVK